MKKTLWFLFTGCGFAVLFFVFYLNSYAIGAVIKDEFAEMQGTFPALFSDNDDSTYVRGGIYPGDWDGEFTMDVFDAQNLEFSTKVDCKQGSCGGQSVCGFVFQAKNQGTGEYNNFAGASWESPGVHEYNLALEDASKYIYDGKADFHISFQCNMDGNVLEFKQKASQGAEEEVVPEEEIVPVEELTEEQKAEQEWFSRKCENAKCSEAEACLTDLKPTEECLVEFIDMLPYIDKSAALVLVAQDVCSLKERMQLKDPIGTAVTAILTIIDFADNALDSIPILGTLASDTVDVIEGIIDCLEGIVYEYYLKDCGGYTWCLVDLGKALIAEANNLGRSIPTISFSSAHSPVEIKAVDVLGNELSPLDGVFKFQFDDLKVVMVTNPEEIEGGYNIELAGTDNGTFTLETTVLDKEGEVKKEMKVENVAINEGEKTYYNVEVPKNLEKIEMEKTELKEANFSDLTSDHWGYEYIKNLAQKGIISGYSNGTVKPNKPITRAELLKIVMDATTFVPSKAYDVPFSDVLEDDWFYGYVASAVNLGIVDGYSDNTFRPGQQIKRGEALKMILSAAFVYTGYTKEQVKEQTNYILPQINFPDIDRESWYMDYIAIAFEAKLVGGYEDGTFKPGNNITRAEASKIVAKLIDEMLSK